MIFNTFSGFTGEENASNCWGFCMVIHIKCVCPQKEEVI